MNNVETTTSGSNEKLSAFWCFLDYTMNKYMPTLLIGFIMFYTLGYETWEPFVVIGLVLFSNSYNFKCGFANACLEYGFVDVNENEDN